MLLPELILVAVAMGLFLLGLSNKASSRRLAPLVSVGALLVAFAVQVYRTSAGAGAQTPHDMFGGMSHDGTYFGTLRVSNFSQYIKLITLGMGMLLTLLAWPTNEEATASASLNFGSDSGEFFALMLLSLTGLMLVAGANDIMLLFLGIELASIPTYILVSVSRPTSMAQEAGVKYFFLGAFAAAVLLFGFSYLYGTTGSTNLYEIMLKLHAGKGEGGVIDWGMRISLSPWQSLAVLMLVAGFAFKMAAVPLQFYAGDVYQGAATPVTAFLTFVPKASGFVALIKVMFALGGPNWLVPEPLVRPDGTGLIWVLAILTMTVGNVLGLWQYNVKRVMAYSSIAHSGYMLAALAALAASQFMGTGATADHNSGLQAVLFYLAAYGVMNVGVFGVLQLMPSRDGKGSAETFEDIAGKGRHHVGLALGMSVCLFSLIGIPMTVGFIGKVLIIKPALAAAVANTVPGATSIKGAMTWLVVAVMVNAAISAGYYLRIVATMFLRSEETTHHGVQHLQHQEVVHYAGPHMDPVYQRPAMPIFVAVVLSVAGTLALGVVPQATRVLGNAAVGASRMEGELPRTMPTAAAAVPARGMVARK
jgi:NADH-quinone oxidoreductase subunit N